MRYDKIDTFLSFYNNFFLEKIHNSAHEILSILIQNNEKKTRKKRKKNGLKVEDVVKTG